MQSPVSKNKGDEKELAVQAYLKRIHQEEDDMLLKAKEGEEAVRNKKKADQQRIK